ncbi:uncharacterized protein LOC124538732 [Vanessa cardui]|uniref:uncharacterized protein LOC124538732 n=1 Tax=Vanessa cardui TaxID=171605 RepID=UPI001F12F0F5|nr:uncharacterized protein LOC124538732 [Vanessa cardui]
MASKSKKILEEIHPLHIIREVQKWPVLYVKDNPERANLHFKYKIWNEIAKALFTDWDSYSESEKECKVSDLTKKWRNLRDTFKRQLATEKKIREGYNIKKKTYVYFKHMLFLLPHVSYSENEASDPVLEPKLNEYFNKREKRKASLKDKERIKRRKIVTATPSPSVQQEEIDEDRHFLMSLVPSFKKMSDDEKLSAKVRILKVIKDIRKKSNLMECMPLADSLSYNVEDADVGDIKVEMLQSEANETPSNDSDSADSENSD